RDDRRIRLSGFGDRDFIHGGRCFGFGRERDDPPGSGIRDEDAFGFAVDGKPRAGGQVPGAEALHRFGRAVVLHEARALVEAHVPRDCFGGEPGRVRRVQRFDDRNPDEFFFVQEVEFDDDFLLRDDRRPSRRFAFVREIEAALSPGDRVNGDARALFDGGVRFRFDDPDRLVLDFAAQVDRIFFVRDPEVAFRPDRDPVRFFDHFVTAARFFVGLHRVEQFAVGAELVDRAEFAFEFFAVDYFFERLDRFDVDVAFGRAARVVDGDRARRVELAFALAGQ